MRQLTWVLVGMLLFSALAVPAPARAAVALAPAGEGFGGTYVVQPGDSLWRIATRYGISLEALMAANHITSDKVILQIGQVLAVPGEAAEAPAGGADRAAATRSSPATVYGGSPTGPASASTR